MKCFNHLEIDAAGSCSDCNKGLCPACIDRFDFTLCVSCLLKHNSRVAKHLFGGLLATFLLFIVASIFVYSDINGSKYPWRSIGTGAMLACTYWGWRFLSDYMPGIGHGSMITWAIFFFIKLIIAFCFGLIIGPFQIFKRFRELWKMREIKNQIKAGEL